MPVLELSTLTLQVDAVLTPDGNPRREVFLLEYNPYLDMLPAPPPAQVCW